jgi:hypothetical protein
MLGRQMSRQRRPTAGSSRMNESSDTPDNPDKPQDYPGLRAELAELVNDFLPVADELWGGRGVGPDQVPALRFSGVAVGYGI